MSYVSAIVPSRSYVEIYLDGRLFMKVRKADFDKLPVSEGEDLDEDLFLSRLSALQYPKAYEAALTMLDRSARTGAEIKNKLVQKGYAQSVADAVAERLSANRLIDDTQIARRLVESAGGKAVGAYAVKRKLRARGIAEDEADEALSSLDEDQQKRAARKAAGQLMRKYEALPPREARAKLTQALFRRGFGWDAIQDAIDALINGEDEEM